jgi:hypothetical protein
MKLTSERLREIIQDEIKSIRESVETLITEGTTSTVAIEDKKGKVHGTYIHSDGYTNGVGAILKKNFMKADKVSDLLDLGQYGISSLGQSIEGGEDHSFAKPKKGETVFYGRDRGEAGDMTSDFKDRDAFLSAHTEEFAYLYSTKDKKWYYNEANKGSEWKEL